jgi:hypothetical protein
MVGVALGQLNDARLEVAAQLAERFGARVIGVAAAEFSPPLYFTEGEPAQKADRSGWAAIKNRLKELKASFAPRYKTVLWKSSGVAARISRRALSSGRPAPAISSWSGKPPVAGWRTRLCRSIRAIS